ncbi:MAG: serine/threonine-protein kinase [Bacteroidota bacterium]
MKAERPLTGSIKVFRDPEKKQGQDTYFFNLNEGMPVELGNGSFGIVFAVSERKTEADANKGSHALKIFYSKDYRNRDKLAEKMPKDEEDTRKRFTLEYTYFHRINDNWQQSHAPDGLIRPEGASINFLDSEAYKALFKLESMKHIKVSNYAILLPRYHGSLKDLLETRIDKNDLTGYEALERSPYPLRISASMPFITSIVSGLEALYTGGHAHLDIKPANIFFKKTGQQNFEVVLADIGYINPLKLLSDVNTLDHSTIEYENVMRLGTRHYRSPEQKYYTDVCEAEIKKDQNGEIHVIIKDPKFKDTLINKGDYLSFSKYDSEALKVVEEFVPQDQNSNKIIIKVGRIRPPERVEIKSEPKTQVVFYKRQYIKTDLFGIGAILFDLITAGESPEYFYESIRKLDTKNESVDSIIRIYEQVVKQKGKHPAHHYFTDLKHKKTGTYAPKLAVEFILKCMLYKAKGTYFHQEKLDNADQSVNPAFVFKKINEELSEKYFPEIMSLNNHINNVIVFTNKVPRRIPKPEPVIEEPVSPVNPNPVFDLKPISQKVIDRITKVFISDKEVEDLRPEPTIEAAPPDKQLDDPTPKPTISGAFNPPDKQLDNPDYPSPPSPIRPPEVEEK